MSTTQSNGISQLSGIDVYKGAFMWATCLGAVTGILGIAAAREGAFVGDSPWYAVLATAFAVHYLLGVVIGFAMNIMLTIGLNAEKAERLRVSRLQKEWKGRKKELLGYLPKAKRELLAWFPAWGWVYLAWRYCVRSTMYWWLALPAGFVLGLVTSLWEGNPWRQGLGLALVFGLLWFGRSLVRREPNQHMLATP